MSLGVEEPPEAAYRLPERFRTRQSGADEIIGPNPGVEIEEIFIELRRLHDRAGEHGVRLTAMMNLMGEEVKQQIAAEFGKNSGAAAVRRNLHPQRLIGLAIAQRDQLLIALSLRRRQ